MYSECALQVSWLFRILSTWIAFIGSTRCKDIVDIFHARRSGWVGETVKSSRGSVDHRAAVPLSSCEGGEFWALGRAPLPLLMKGRNMAIRLA